MPKVVWDKVVLPYAPSALGREKPEVQFVMRAAPLAYDGKVIAAAMRLTLRAPERS